MCAPTKTNVVGQSAAVKTNKKVKVEKVKEEKNKRIKSVVFQPTQDVRIITTNKKA